MTSDNKSGDQGPNQFLSAKRSWLILASIVVLSGVLLFMRLDISPPGLNQDEAANAWNAYTILKNGTDQVGESWPIFYSHAIGGNRTTLYLYYLTPFLAGGDLSIWTVRFASAVAGVLAVLLAYVVGAKMFNRPVGLVAAGLLALSPWFIQSTRWAHEAALCPLLVLFCIALCLWANLPICDAKDRKPRPFIALLAGLIIGISCYGYGSIRIFLPAVFLAILAVTWRGWWQMLKTKRGVLAIAALVVGVAVTFGPLAWQHVFHPEGVAMRGKTTMLWNETDSATEKFSKVSKRYIHHFGPDFLFSRGDLSEIHSPPDIGQLHWYMLPLMLAGAGVCIYRFRASPAARIVLVWFLLYPAGDCLSKHVSLHALRSLPGLPGLILLAAIGAVVVGQWLWKRSKRTAWLAGAVMAVAVIGLNVKYLTTYFGEFNERPNVYHLFHTDLNEAYGWLKPRLDDYDAVFTTTSGMNQPYLISLVALEHDPEKWFAEPKDYSTAGDWDLYTRYGKMYFMYPNQPGWIEGLRELMENGREDRVAFIVRPLGAIRPRERNWYEQFYRKMQFAQPIHVIRRPDPNLPDGVPVLYLCEKTL